MRKSENMTISSGHSKIFQIWLFLGIGFINSLVNLELMATNFLSPVYQHWCDIPGLQNLSSNDRLQLSAPPDPHSMTGFDTCKVRDSSITSVKGPNNYQNKIVNTP